MNKQEFILWYDDFYRRMGGRLIDTKTVPLWWERCEKNHESVRGFLGGTRKLIEVAISTEPNPSVTRERISKEANSLFNLIPEYFNRYNIVSDFQNRLRYPVLGIKPFEKYPWGKHIKIWVRKHNKKTPEGLKKVDENKEHQIDMLICDMGKIWSEAILQTTKMYLNITTSPESFIMLGNYGKDSGSCFKPAGLNSIHRYTLGESPDTFVGLVLKEPEENGGEKENNPNILTRFWGKIDESRKAVYCNNFYPKTPENNGTILRCIEKALESLIGEKTKVVENLFTFTGVYFNGLTSKTDPKAHIAENFLLNKNDKNSIKTTFFLKPQVVSRWQKCSRCDDRKNNPEGWEDIDFWETCPQCSKNALLCYLCGEKTFESCRTLKTRENEMGFGKLSLLEKNKWVVLDSYYYHKDDVVEYKGRKMGKWDMAELIEKEEKEKRNKQEDIKTTVVKVRPIPPW